MSPPIFKYEDIPVIVTINNTKRGKKEYYILQYVCVYIMCVYSIYNFLFSAHCYSHLLMINTKTSLTRALAKSEAKMSLCRFHFREQKDPFYLREKLSQKHSKEQFEAAQKIEQDYSRFFTGWSQRNHYYGIVEHLR